MLAVSATVIPSWINQVTEFHNSKAKYSRLPTQKMVILTINLRKPLNCFFNYIFVMNSHMLVVLEEAGGQGQGCYSDHWHSGVPAEILLPNITNYAPRGYQIYYFNDILNVWHPPQLWEVSHTNWVQLRSINDKSQSVFLIAKVFFNKTRVDCMGPF